MIPLFDKEFIMSNLEADLYHTLKNVNDLTKSNVTENLQNAIASGQLALDQNALKQVVTVVNATLDQSVDTAHTQVIRVNAANTKTRKKPTGRTAKK